MFSKIKDWLDVRDHDRGSARASRNAISRVARRNTRMQDGDFVSPDDHKALVEEGTRSIQRLKGKLQPR
jgi:hypothetical protein